MHNFLLDPHALSQPNARRQKLKLRHPSLPGTRNELVTDLSQTGKRKQVIHTSFALYTTFLIVIQVQAQAHPSDAHSALGPKPHSLRKGSKVSSE